LSATAFVTSWRHTGECARARADMYGARSTTCSRSPVRWPVPAMSTHADARSIAAEIAAIAATACL